MWMSDFSELKCKRSSCRAGLLFVFSIISPSSGRSILSCHRACGHFEFYGPFLFFFFFFLFCLIVEWIFPHIYTSRFNPHNSRLSAITCPVEQKYCSASNLSGGHVDVTSRRR